MRLGGVVVPAHPGLFSAAGLVATDLRIDESQTVLRALGPGSLADVAAWYRETGRRIVARFREDGIPRSRVRLVASADCRYLGQGYELSVPLRGSGTASLARLREDFHAIHARTYGHVNPEEEVELVTLRLSGLGALGRPEAITLPAGGPEPPREAVVERREVVLPGARRRRRVSVLRRELLRARNRIQGPAIVEEMDSTTVILPGQEARVDRSGDLWIREVDRG
jgi:N-methylhydantoinase A